MDTPGTEELSFGGDPDREPWVRAWVWAHRRLLAVAAAALVLLALAGGGGYYLYDQARKPLPPPAGPWPEQLRFAVALCDDQMTSVQKCEHQPGKDSETAAAVEAALRADPAVVSVVFRSKQAEYAQGLKQEALLLSGPVGGWAGGGPGNTPRTFYGTLRHSADYARVAARTRAMPGVLAVNRVRTDFWQGKAEVAVVLCGDHSAIVLCPRHTDQSDDQRQAIVDRLRGIAGVDAVYFEDRAHALEALGRYLPEERDSGRLGLSITNESLYVKVSDPRSIAVIGREMRDVPGVHLVWKIASD